MRRALHEMLGEAKETPEEKKIAEGFKGMAQSLKSQTDMWERSYKGNRNTKAGAYLCLGQILSSCMRMAEQGLKDPKLAAVVTKAMRAASQAGTDELHAVAVAGAKKPEEPEKKGKKKRR
jgi:hypothetical protein